VPPVSEKNGEKSMNKVKKGKKTTKRTHALTVKMQHHGKSRSYSLRCKLFDPVQYSNFM